MQFIQERRPDRVLSNVAVKIPLTDVFSSVHNVLVAGHGASILLPKIDYCDSKFQKKIFLVM